MASLNTLKRTTKRRSASVGRGGKRGKTSGRGTKGQKARAGNRRRPEMRDTIKKFPKLRGHGKNRSRTVNSGRVKAVAVSLSDLSMFSMSDPVTLSSLVEKGVVRMRAGRPPMIKIVANGVLTTAVTVTGVPTSATAKQAIEKAGGQVK